MDVRIAYSTHRGCVRRMNEDRAVAQVLPLGAFFGVYDGMGGEKGGAIASAVCAQTLEEAVAQVPPSSSASASELVVRALRVASFRINTLARLREPIDLHGMGTTASVAAIVGDRMIYGQIGDSRIYVLRAGELQQVTRDQSLVQIMIERGQLRPEDAETFGMRNVILQAVGPSPSVDVDLRAIRLGKGDLVLACSDGLYGAVRAEDIARVLARAAQPEAACRALVDAALAAGADDNVTCVVALVCGGEDRSREPIVVEQL